MTKRLDTPGSEMLAWFRRGFDTEKLAFLTGLAEHEVVRRLSKAREDERNQNNASLSSEREQALEDE